MKIPHMTHIQKLAEIRDRTNECELAVALEVFEMTTRLKNDHVEKMVDWWDETGEENITLGGFRNAWIKITGQ